MYVRDRSPALPIQADLGQSEEVRISIVESDVECVNSSEIFSIISEKNVLLF